MYSCYHICCRINTIVSFCFLNEISLNDVDIGVTCKEFPRTFEKCFGHNRLSESIIIHILFDDSFLLLKL